MSGGSKGDSYKETPEQRELARIAKEQWQHYTKEYVPQEMRYMEMVDNMDTTGARQNLAGKISTATADHYKSANAQAVQEMSARGINPVSGQYQHGVGDTYQEIAQSSGESQQQAQIEFGNRKIGHTQNVVNIGQGQGTSAVSGLNQIAQQSQQTAINDAQNDFKERQATQNMVGTAAGLGVSYWANNQNKAGGQQ
jgi:hypothetical protein